MNTIQITYNDEFDREKYPVADWHRETIGRIASHFEIPFDMEWLYHATIQGRVFWPKTSPARAARLHADDVKFLSEIPGFRWVEYGAEMKFGLTHQQP